MENHPIWHPVAFRPGDTRRYDIGPLTLIIGRRHEEWRVRYHSANEPLREVFRYSNVTPDEIAHPNDIVERIAAHDDEDSREIILQPLLADRYVSARPETPVTIAPGSWATMYLTTPLWLRVLLLPARRMILELPSFRPVDTWLGGPTGDGPLAYASRVRGRLNLDEMHLSPMRAITKVTLRNSGAAPMHVARIIVPAPELQLYTNEAHRLWTDEVTITKGRDGELSEVRIDNRAPKEAGTAIRLAEARTSTMNNLLDRAISSLLGS